MVTRRDFLLGAAALPALAADRKPVERPSFLVVVADELPAWVLGCYGNKEVRTPNLDRLAATGTLFTNHAACAPVPGTGRATLLTGLTPMQAAATAESARVGLDKILGGAGYACHAAASVDDAGKFLDQQRAGNPFLLTAALGSPQPPYENLPRKYRDLYAQTRFETFNYQAAAANARTGKQMLGDILASLRQYAAAVSMLDDNLGALVAGLNRRGLLESTAILFTSSCGALLGRHGLWGAADSSEPPNLYQEVVGTPMIWSWLGHVPAQTQRPERVSAYDLLPTLCEAAGVRPPAGRLCGRSYLAIATGKLLKVEEGWSPTVFAAFENTAMARDRRYKLVLRDTGKGPNALFDLTGDPREMVDHYADDEFLNVRNALAGQLAEWTKKYSA